jgi:anti-sigma factor RsiW
MTDNKPNGDQHVGEMLSGYIDGELTQQARQRVRLHCDTCATCRKELETLEDMRERIGNATLSDRDQDTWRENMDDKAVKTTRGAGWLLLVGGALLGGAFLGYELFSSASRLSLFEKVVFGGIYGGLLLLFLSVLRQRLIERKTDKYKDVEI